MILLKAHVFETSTTIVARLRHTFLKMLVNLANIVLLLGFIITRVIGRQKTINV